MYNINKIKPCGTKKRIELTCIFRMFKYKPFPARRPNSSEVDGLFPCSAFYRLSLLAQTHVLPLSGDKSIDALSLPGDFPRHTLKRGAICHLVLCTEWQNVLSSVYTLTESTLARQQPHTQARIHLSPQRVPRI